MRANSGGSGRTYATFEEAMANAIGKDEPSPPIAVPVGDPNVIRSIQYFLDLAKEGKISGVAIVALDAVGNVYSNPTLPQHPGALHLALGALSSLSIDINDTLRQFKQKMSASPIIKPNGFHS